MELREWLENNIVLLSHRWLAEIEARWDSAERRQSSLLSAFLRRLVELLPGCMGHHRDSAEELWEQGTHLYGSYAVRRGLAAGEVVEELQLLRGTILRQLLSEYAGGKGPQIPHREFLALNEVLDLGIARASVAYVDDLFFSHLQGSGVPEGTDPDVEEELWRQLEALRCESVGKD